MESLSNLSQKKQIQLESAKAQPIQITREVRRLKVACVSVPEAGHLVPTVEVAKALAQRGHETALLTLDSAAPKFAKSCEAAGCRFVGLAPDLPGSDAGHGPVAELMSRGLMSTAMSHVSAAMLPELLAWLKAERPDVVLADFATQAASQAVEELGIPMLLNVPGPLELFKHLDMLFALPFCLKIFLASRNVQETRLTYRMFTQLVPMLKTRVCLVNSFFGLDLAHDLPPHVVVTGSTAARPSTTRRTETSDSRLNAWLTEMRQRQLRLVYVTMGSMQVLEPFQLKALYEGLRALKNVAVCWSLKEEQHQQLGGLESLPAHFYVSKWLPQGEAMQLPEVAVVVTHCGFGGLNETIAAGKPMVALPFRADQPKNAEIAHARGMAEVLQPRKLTAAAVTSAVTKVLEDPRYQQRASELQRQLLKTKGAEACVEAIERFAENDGCEELFARPTKSWTRSLLGLAPSVGLVLLGRMARRICFRQRTASVVVLAIRELVLSEVEHKVQEKSEEMWSKGKQFVSQLQLRHAEKMTEMVEDLGRCQKKQSELEAENERLKQALQSLGSHFALLGNSFDSKEYNSSPDSAVSTAPGLSPPEEPEAKAPPYTPEPYAQAAQAAAEVLAQVPPFPPFGSPAPMSPPPAISIAESLGAGVSTPQRTPLSLMQSLATPLTPLPSPFTVNGLAGVGLVGGCGIFSFTLRKADGAELGLNVSHSADDRVLCVEGIREGGAVEAWNRQCGAGTPFAEKTVLPGDRILSVNKVSYDPNLMLQDALRSR
ncbi:unnamed protein product [Effrenium voratum]|nr:unnamed protein product [Effrenium voratum]